MTSSKDYNLKVVLQSVEDLMRVRPHINASLHRVIVDHYVQGHIMRRQ